MCPPHSCWSPEFPPRGGQEALSREMTKRVFPRLPEPLFQPEPLSPGPTAPWGLSPTALWRPGVGSAPRWHPLPSPPESPWPSSWPWRAVGTTRRGCPGASQVGSAEGSPAPPAEPRGLAWGTWDSPTVCRLEPPPLRGCSSCPALPPMGRAPGQPRLTPALAWGAPT